MRPIEARYEDGLLRLDQPLPLRSGERVGLILLRRSDPARWDLKRLGTNSREDETLSGTGLDLWAEALDDEDRR